MRSPITTHVLDVSRGCAAAGVPVILEQQEGTSWRELARGQTNADGRVETLLPAGSKAKPGLYRLQFDSASYYRAHGGKPFFPQIAVVFELSQPEQHHHVPILLAPYGYSTYRGT